MVMKPKFANELAWQQAEMLMQPAYIRLVDQIRRYTETSKVDVSYEEVTEPYPSNILILRCSDRAKLTEKGDRELRADIWELCFQVCFTNYEEMQQGREEFATIDRELFDLESQEVDWQKLDEKAQGAIGQIFTRFKLLAN
jgi:hypothetical protein